MDILPNKILACILNFVSDVSCGFARVSKRFNSLFIVIKEERIKDEKECFERFTPLIIFTSYNKISIFGKVCRLGNKYVIVSMISKGANYWNMGMFAAAKGGHRYWVEFFIEKGSDANNLNWGMLAAAEGDHKHLVEFFIEKGAKDWNME